MTRAQICVALALLQIASMVLNTAVFPDVAPISPISREISTFCGAAFSVVVALTAYFRPALMRERALSAILIALLAASLVLLCIGVQEANPLLIAVGSPFGGIGMVWFSVLVGVALSKLDRNSAITVIPLAFVIGYGIQLAIAQAGGLGTVAGAAVYFAAIVSAYLLIAPLIEDQIAAIRQVEAPTVLDTTNPSSFLPFSSLVFVTILLFNVACGFQATLPGGGLPPFELWLSFLSVALVLLLALAGRSRHLSADSLEIASALLVLAGFLLVPLTLFPGGPLGFAERAPALLLRSGSDCFSVLTYFIIASVGMRNPLGALTTSASAMAAAWVGIGCGAAAMTGLQALAAHNPEWLILGSQLAAFAFTAYIFAGLKSFSFEAAIAGVVPPWPGASTRAKAEGGEAAAMVLATAANATPLAEGAPAPGEPRPSSGEAAVSEDARFLQACAAVAKEHGLTGREEEVLRLLARGRTGPVIQERLVVSHNTVKSHVRHIYAKMGVHSQQQLMDVVDRTLERQ